MSTHFHETDSLETPPIVQSSASTESAPQLRVVHVTSSRFFGGPERQMLELAREMAPSVQSAFVSFSEQNLCRAFLREVSLAGFEALSLRYDMPRLFAAACELQSYLRVRRPQVVCVHGYKAGILGVWAARRCRIPVVAVSRGWTFADWKVRLYERLDRIALRWMDRVVCVSEGQANKVRSARVPQHKVTIIHNAIRGARFQIAQRGSHREQLQGLFTFKPKTLICAAGRLSPEKGFDVLIEACADLIMAHPELNVGVALFGEGDLRSTLQRRIQSAGMKDRIVLAGFSDQFDTQLSSFDLFVQSSHTEGLPNVLLEAAAAGVPLVATDVGGTSEVVLHEQTGLLVPPNNAKDLALSIARVLMDADLRLRLSANAQAHVTANFTFAAQAAAYRHLFKEVLSHAPGATTL
jgi:glycosyltransferase involved in cell wall biosynthesis